MKIVQSTGLQDLISAESAYAQQYEALVAATKHCSATELRNMFPREYNSWQNRKGWAKKHGVAWAADLTDFDAFLLALGPIPHDKWTLDRIDPKSGYLQANLRWASKQEQAQNRTTARTIVVDGIAQTITGLSRVLGKSYDAIRMALNRHGASHAAKLLALPSGKEPQNPEDSWQFPEDYRASLENEYEAARNSNENRFRFFVRFTRSNLAVLEFAHAISPNPQSQSELDAEITLIRSLHNKAIEEVRRFERQQESVRAYGHLKLPDIQWNIENDHPEWLEYQRTGGF